MALVKYTERKRSGYVDAEGYRYYTRVFQVETDTGNHGPGSVAAMVPIAWGAAYDLGFETDVFARLKVKRADLVDDTKFIWSVACEYDSKPYGQGQSGLGGTTGGDPTAAPPAPTGPPQNTADTPPADRPWLIKKSSRKVQVARVEDVGTTPRKYQSSAKQPLDPVPLVTLTVPVLTITAFKPITWPALAKSIEFTDTVNDATYLGQGALTVHCADYQYEEHFEQDEWFYKIDVTLELATEAVGYDWDRRILDAGTYERLSAAKPYTAIVDSTGNPVQSPVPLDGTGKKLADGASPVYLIFKQFKEKDFTGLL